jgi:hypothetical protein
MASGRAKDEIASMPALPASAGLSGARSRKFLLCFSWLVSLCAAWHPIRTPRRAKTLDLDDRARQAQRNRQHQWASPWSRRPVISTRKKQSCGSAAPVHNSLQVSNAIGEGGGWRYALGSFSRRLQRRVKLQATGQRDEARIAPVQISLADEPHQLRTRNEAQ